MIKVGLVQINNEFSGQCYFPYSVGILQAYAQKHLALLGEIDFLLPIYKRLRVTEAVERLGEADIVGFSTYVWNFEISRAIAKALKERQPETVIVFGGPHVPDSMKQFQRVRKSQPQADDLKRGRVGVTEEFHRRNPFVDIACHGEGEQVFATILERFCHGQSMTDIPSISFLDENGNFRHNFKLVRMMDLSAVPSPYISGVFDQLMTANPDQNWIGMWESNRGCPYQCTYCDWGGAIEDKIAQFNLESLYGDIEWFGRHQINYVFCADANFGILKRDVKIARKLAEVRAKYGFPRGLSVQNAKNPKEHTLEALEVLEKAGINKAVVMSLQSTNPDTLKAVRRENMEVELYRENQRRLAAEGIYTMTDIIFPMPNETYESVAAGVGKIIEDGDHNRIQFGKLSILPNAEMADPEYQAEFGFITVQTKIINIHGKKVETGDDIKEWQTLVVATKTMPPDDYIRVCVYTWFVGLLYFNKLLQIPFALLHKVYGISFRDLFELFSQTNPANFALSDSEYPILAQIRALFTKTAQELQSGLEGEFIHSNEWLNVSWPPEEYAFIQLCRENKLTAFYKEIKLTLFDFLSQRAIDFDLNLINESILLNQSLLKIPFQNADLALDLNYNIWEVYRGVLLGQTIKLKKESTTYIVERSMEKWETWEVWYEKMVWYCNRQGAYLYGAKPVLPTPAGHY